MSSETTNLVMPKLGLTMKQGKLTRWYCRPGEDFRGGKPLFQVTTEKVAVDVDAPRDGVLVEILVPLGETVPVATPIARVSLATAARAGSPAPSPRAETPTPPRAAEDSLAVPHSDWRRATAERMSLAARSVAPVTLHRRVEVDAVARIVASPSARQAGVGAVDFVVWAVAGALTQHPDLNASFTEEALARHSQVNIGVALALPGGLVVPVVKQATGLGPAELAGRRRALWDRARSGRLRPDDVTGGTFTVTNLGPFGVEDFTPIINLPEVAVLGVGRMQEQPVVRDGQVSAGRMLPLSLTFDHRAVDGAPAAAFLGDVASRLSNPLESIAAEATEPRVAIRTRAAGDDPDAFDLVVVGSGPGGFTAAVTAAELGAKVAVVEMEEVGGVCLNRGCIPTKAALERLACHGRDLAAGGAAPGGETPAKGLSAAVESVVSTIRAGAEENLAELGVSLLRGQAGVSPAASPGGAPLVTLGERALRAPAVILSTGSEPVPFELPASIVAGEAIPVEELLARDREPGRVLVIGGGPGGVEGSRILALAGAEVTLVERLPSLLPGEEDDIGEFIRLALEDLGVNVKTGVDVAALPTKGSSKPGFDLVVLAVGRRARLGDLALEELGEKVFDARGFVRVDDYLRTAVPGLFAAGDMVGPPYWAHRAMEQGRAAALNAVAGLEGLPKGLAWQKGPKPELITRVVFTDPEVGAVGLTRRQAEEAGHEVVVGTAPMGASSRARAANKGEGFIRVVADRRTARLLGVEAVCPGATELAGIGLLALKSGMTVFDLGGTPFAHPTYSESLGDAARDAIRLIRA